MKEGGRRERKRGNERAEERGREREEKKRVRVPTLRK